MPDLLVPARFNGPPSSGNGGWSAGAISALAGDACPDDHASPWPTIAVSLRLPPPLDTPLTVTRTDQGAVASYDGGTVLEATCTDNELADVDPVTADDARAAMAGFPGLSSHPFPTCFSCGTAREQGDGLRIFPGPVAGQQGANRVASTWTPHPSVAEDFHVYADEHARASLPVTWAALDCIGGWAGDMTDRLMVLGRMTARIDSLPVIGEEHVVVGLDRGHEGRKTFTASALYDADGRIVATAEHVWIAIDPNDFA
jgi:hypothetical protein